MLDAIGTVGGVFGVIWSVSGIFMGLLVDRIFVYYLKQKKEPVFNQGMFSYDSFKQKENYIDEQEPQHIEEHIIFNY